MKRKELEKFLKWVDEHTYFCEDKDVTISQVVNEYINITELKRTANKNKK